MRPLPPDTPGTEGGLFDRLSEMFGIGVWDETTAAMPYWKWRAREIAKVKAVLRKHDRAVADLYVAALYAKAEGRDIRAVSWLPRDVPRAWRWWEDRVAETQLLGADEGFAEALVIEMERSNTGDDAWFGRLVRCPPANREEVYQQWLSERSSPTTPSPAGTARTS